MKKLLPSPSYFRTAKGRAQAAACMALAAADFVYHKHPYFDYEKWPGFYAGYGLLCCLGAAFAARLIQHLLAKDERYYDR